MLDRRPPLLSGLALALAMSAASAEDRPPAMPTRDVVVTYKVDRPPPFTDTVAWLVAEGRIRTEGVNRRDRVAHLIDTRGNKVVVVLDKDREYTDFGPLAAAMTMDYVFARPGLTLTEEGSDTIAGEACTVWRIDPAGIDDPDSARHACITADGVPLRLVDGCGAAATTRYTATRVVYGPQDPARFRPPADYKHADTVGGARRR